MRAKFYSPEALVRCEALERLFDHWDRMKSLADSDKRVSICKILDRTSSEPVFRSVLEVEAKALTEIGNLEPMVVCSGDEPLALGQNAPCGAAHSAAWYSPPNT